MWFSGLTSGIKSTGWLGRWIDRNGDPANPLQAISIDTALSKAIRTAHMPVCAIPSLSALGFGYSFNGAGYPTSSTAPNVPLNAELNALAGLVADPGNAYLDRVAVDVRPGGRDLRRGGAGPGVRGRRGLPRRPGALAAAAARRAPVRTTSARGS